MTEVDTELAAIDKMLQELEESLKDDTAPSASEATCREAEQDDPLQEIRELLRYIDEGLGDGTTMGAASVAPRKRAERLAGRAYLYSCFYSGRRQLRSIDIERGLRLMWAAVRAARGTYSEPIRLVLERRCNQLRTGFFRHSGDTSDIGQAFRSEWANLALDIYENYYPLEEA